MSAEQSQFDFDVNPQRGVLPRENGERLLVEARAELESVIEKGADCPLCGRFAKIYRRKLLAPTGYLLLLMLKYAPDEWVYVPTFAATHAKTATASVILGASRLKLWGLLKALEDATEEEKTGKRSGPEGDLGYYRLTPLGERFALSQTVIPKYVWIYDNRVLSFDHTEKVSIRDVLTEKFDYEALMRGE